MQISDKNEREKFLNWVWDLETNIFGLPKPTEVFFLNMPPKNSLELIKNIENKFSHTAEKDIHERNPEHIIDSYNAACELVSKYNWYEVKCIKNEKLRTIEDIHEEIFNEVIKHIK